uniref:Uncharacterized protein n=1 Tax=Glossina pallidipes TaxID=7398 RepID=A0A1B0AJ43_GLOPL
MNICVIINLSNHEHVVKKCSQAINLQERKQIRDVKGLHVSNVVMNIWTLMEFENFEDQHSWKEALSTFLVYIWLMTSSKIYCRVSKVSQGKKAYGHLSERKYTSRCPIALTAHSRLIPKSRREKAEDFNFAE